MQSRSERQTERTENVGYRKEDSRSNSRMERTVKRTCAASSLLMTRPGIGGWIQFRFGIQIGSNLNTRSHACRACSPATKSVGRYCNAKPARYVDVCNRRGTGIRRLNPFNGPFPWSRCPSRSARSPCNPPELAFNPRETPAIRDVGLVNFNVSIVSCRANLFSRMLRFYCSRLGYYAFAISRRRVETTIAATLPISTRPFTARFILHKWIRDNSTRNLPLNQTVSLN